MLPLAHWLAICNAKRPKGICRHVLLHLRVSRVFGLINYYCYSRARESDTCWPGGRNTEPRPLIYYINNWRWSKFASLSSWCQILLTGDSIKKTTRLTVTLVWFCSFSFFKTSRMTSTIITASVAMANIWSTVLEKVCELSRLREVKLCFCAWRSRTASLPETRDWPTPLPSENFLAAWWLFYIFIFWRHRYRRQKETSGVRICVRVCASVFTPARLSACVLASNSQRQKPGCSRTVSAPLSGDTPPGN